MVVLLFVLPGGWALVGMLLVSYVSTVLTGALVGPFNAAVLALQYYDQRFRKEGLDIQLLNQSLRARAAVTHLWTATPGVLFPDPEPARDWLRDELARPEYQESLLERFARWFNELVESVREATGTGGGLNPLVGPRPARPAGRRNRLRCSPACEPTRRRRRRAPPCSPRRR